MASNEADAMPSPSLPHLLRDFARDESGATAMEYGLIALLIGLATVTAARSLGAAINTQITAVGTKVGSDITVP